VWLTYIPENSRFYIFEVFPKQGWHAVASHWLNIASGHSTKENEKLLYPDLEATLVNSLLNKLGKLLAQL
jgi:hypothetical protein